MYGQEIIYRHTDEWTVTVSRKKKNYLSVMLTLKNSIAAITGGFLFRLALQLLLK